MNCTSGSTWGERSDPPLDVGFGEINTLKVKININGGRARAPALHHHKGLESLDASGI